ncbi:MAG: hypothetical protein C0594_00680 [Marinilabiliales bacterium]|nr:MAG: hypothetical protein C0594_00680 [Marinilabiliales bacterium]
MCFTPHLSFAGTGPINKTGYEYGLIELLLWQKCCYEIQGLWEYDAEYCIKCNSSKLLLKKVEGVDFVDKVICQECGYEMTIGERGLESFRVVKEWIPYLNEIILFPFEAEVCEYQEGELICQGDKLKVHNIEGEDDLLGMIVIENQTPFGLF